MYFYYISCLYIIINHKTKTMKHNLIIAAVFLIILAGCTEPAPETEANAAENNNTESTMEALSENLEYGMDTYEDWGEEGQHDVLGEQQREKLVTWIFEAVSSGKLTAYAHPLGEATKDEQYALSVEDFNKLISRTDTVYTEDIETHELIETLVDVKVTPDEIARLYFVEEWSIDSENYRME